EVADRAGADGRGQRPVNPADVAPGHEKPPDQVAGREVVVTGDGDDRPAEHFGHVVHEAGLPATGRPGQHDGEPGLPGRLDGLLLRAARDVVGVCGIARSISIHWSISPSWT